MDSEVIGGCDLEKGVGLGDLVPFEFEVNEDFEEGTRGGIRKVDDGPAGVVPARRGAKAAFSGEGLVVADAPERPH